MSDVPDHEEWSEAQAETTVTVDGHEVSMAYRDEGEGDPLVFVHGIPSWGYLWRRIAPHFEDEYRVIVPDLVGYGNSDMRDGFDRSIRAQEQALTDLLDGLGIDDYTAVAHDIGGGAILRMAAHQPDRISQLVCSNVVCYDSWPVDFIVTLGLPETGHKPVEEVYETVAGAFAEGVYADEADDAFVEGMAAPWNSEEGTTSLARCAVATNTNHTTEIDYGAIDVDLLCLWAEDDIFQPIEYGERLADEIGGEVVPLSNAYHWVVEDRPEQYVEELQAFL